MEEYGDSERNALEHPIFRHKEPTVDYLNENDRVREKYRKLRRKKRHAAAHTREIRSQNPGRRELYCYRHKVHPHKGEFQEIFLVRHEQDYRGKDDVVVIVRSGY